jgi:hypothetical protein
MLSERRFKMRVKKLDEVKKECKETRKYEDINKYI